MLADASFLRLVLAVSILLLASGCYEPEIKSYTVPRITNSNVKPPVGPAMPGTAATTGSPQRMLGGLLLAGKTAWFFKVMDDPAAVEPQVEAFKKWVETVRIESSDNPTWELPKDWEAQAGNQFRFATIKMGSGLDAPELSVSKLEQGEGADKNAYLLANLNRWRGQLQLPEWSVEEMLAAIEHIKAGERSVVYVDLKGTGGSGGMTPPFANRPPPPRVDVPPPATNASDNGGFDFEKPESWQQVQPTSAIVQLAFRAKEEDAILDITVTQLAGPAGGTLANINRWRGQLQLPPTDETALAAELKDVPSGLGAAKWIEIVDTSDPKRAIYAAIINGKEATWFLKAMGSAAVAEKEKANLLEFIKSLKTEN